MRTLLESRGHRKDIDALADNSHLSEAFLELIEEVSDHELFLLEYSHSVLQILDDIRYRHSSTSEEAEDSILPTEDATFRSRLRRASIHLAKVSNCMPPSLYLTVVVLEHPECLTGGGFADIYQGKHNDQLVAVKRLRVFLYQSPKDRARTSKVVHNIQYFKLASYPSQVVPPRGPYVEAPRSPQYSQIPRNQLYAIHRPLTLLVHGISVDGEGKRA